MSATMHGPFMKSAVPVRQYRLDPYFAALLTQVDGLGPVQLLHVLVVYKTGEADPVFFVTAELDRPKAAAEAGGTGPDPPVPCLCIFDENGLHSHLEYSPQWADLESFALRALAIVEEHFGVVEQQ